MLDIIGIGRVFTIIFSCLTYGLFRIKNKIPLNKNVFIFFWGFGLFFFLLANFLTGLALPLGVKERIGVSEIVYKQFGVIGLYAKTILMFLALYFLKFHLLLYLLKFNSRLFYEILSKFHSIFYRIGRIIEGILNSFYDFVAIVFFYHGVVDAYTDIVNFPTR